MKAQPKKNSVESTTILATIYGRCTDKKVGTTDYGPFVRFLGEFEGVNADTGAVFRSGELIVPRTLESLLDGAVSVATENDASGAVEFAVEIWVDKDESSITGYTYQIKPLIKPAESDALTNLRQLVAPSTQKQLAMDEKKK